MPDFTPCWPGLESSLHLESSDRRALFRKRSVPSRRASLHFGPVYRAILVSRSKVKPYFRPIWLPENRGQSPTILSGNSRTKTSALDPAPLRRPAAVVRHWCHVGNAGDLESERIQGAHRRLTSRPRALDPHLEVLNAALLRRLACRFGGDLRRERRRLARALEARAARRRPGQGVALAIGDGDDRVVERRVDVRNALRYVLLDLLARPRDSLGRCLCHSLSFLMSSILDRRRCYLAAGLAVGGLAAGLAAPRDDVACRAFLGPLRVRALVRVR